MPLARTVAVLLLSTLLVTSCTASIFPEGESPPPESAVDVGLPWWNDRVFYEVAMRQGSDSDGDEIGDLSGLLGNLDRFNDGDPDSSSDLGVSGLLLSNLLESSSVGGHDVIDYRSVDSDLGTNADLQAVVEAAHARGMAVIIDLTFNHTSVDHPWFGAALDGRSPDYYVWDEQPATREGWHPTEGASFYGAFGASTPDLNLVNRRVGEELVDVGEFWLTEFGVDGFRLRDVSYYVETENRQENTDESKAWAEEYDDRLDAFVPNAVTVGEIKGSTRETADWIGPVDLALDAQRGQAIVAGLESGQAAGLIESQRQLVSWIPDAQYGVALDEGSARLADPARRAAAVLLLTERGVPFVRLPSFDDDELGAHFRALIELRNATPALRLGGTSEVETNSDQVYAFLRHLDDHQVLVIVNLGDQPTSDVQVTLDPSLLTEDPTPRVLMGDGSLSPLPSPSALGITWEPVGELSGYQSAIIRLD